MIVGEQIKALRKKRGLTQKALGELSGINEVQIRQYELKRANPKIETIQKIATALDVSTFDLLNFKSEKETQEEILKDLELEKLETEIGAIEEVADERLNELIKYKYWKIFCIKNELPNEAISDLKAFCEFLEYKYKVRTKAGEKPNGKENEH